MNATVKFFLFDVLMQSATQPFYLPSIPIIFKSKENLDNNYKKTIKNDPFIGYKDLSGVIISGSLIDTHERVLLIYLLYLLSIKVQKRNGIARRKWTII